MAAASGCGTLGGGPASDRLPSAGVTGWRLLPAKAGTSIVEPFVFCSTAGVSRPAVIETSDGWKLWYVAGDGTIGRASSSDGLYDWTDDGPVSLAGGPWADVSVAVDAGDWRLAAAAADGTHIDVFASMDASLWTPSGSLDASAPWTAGDIGGPALLADRAAGGWLLFHDGARRQAIGAASSTDGVSWTDGSVPLFTVSSVRAETGWSVLALGAAAAGLDTRGPGDPVYKLWYEARELRTLPTPSLDEAVDVIGFAGSFDAQSWVTWSGNPVFQQRVITIPGSPAVFTSTREPSVVADAAGYRMFFESNFALDGQPIRPCIAVAVDP